MATIELADVVESISRLQLNYTSLADQFYNIFFNPEPMNVTIVFKDENGEELEVTIPNRAKDQKFIMNGEGSPIVNNVSAAIGTIYQDTVNGELYIKYNEGSADWTCIVTANAMKSILRQGKGSPEGAEVASLGVIYVDTQNGYMYMKRTSTGNTGWVRIDSYATSKVTEVFTIDKETSSIVLSGVCENKDVLSIFEDGVKLNPSTYDMPYGDRKTIILRKPIKTPGEGETTEIIVEYFVDIHVAESVVEQRLVDYAKESRFYSEGISEADYNLNYLGEVAEKTNLPEDTSSLKEGDYYYCVLEQCNCIWDGADWKYEYSAKYWRDQANDIYTKANFDITEAEKAIADAGKKAQEDFQQLYDDTHNLVTSTREYIDENYEKFSDGVNRVDNYAQEVAKNRNAVALMLDDVKKLEQNTYNYANYVEVTVNDLATKTEFAEFKDELETALEDAKTTLDRDIQTVKNNLTIKIDTINEDLSQKIADESSERTKATTRLQGNIDFNQSTFENWVASHSDLGNFTNNAEYINRTNYPIDVSGVYHYSQIIDIPADDTKIDMVVVKDCSYYSADIGEYMESVTHGDTTFTFDVTPDSKSINFSLPDQLKSDKYTKDFDNVVCTVRLYLQNESQYTPSIDWGYTKISWLGAEPELEAGKSYIVELVSYDMMTSWEAHVLGICQPAIELDTFTSTFSITSSALAKHDLPSGNTSDIRVVAVIDGRELTVEDSFEFDNKTGKVTVPMEIERRFMGKPLTELQIKSVYTPAFERYYGDNLGITLAQGTNYNVTCEKEKTIDASFIIHIQSDIIESYMRGGLSLDDYTTYLTQVENEKGSNYHFANDFPQDLDEDGDPNDKSGIWIINSDTTHYWVWYENIGEWKSSTRIVPDGKVISQLDLQGRFKFDWGNIGETTNVSATYYYSPTTSSAVGANFEFTVADGVMVDPLVAKSDDNHVTNIRVRYDGYDNGKAISALDLCTVKTNGRVSVDAETVTTW